MHASSFADNLLVIDHSNNDIYILSLNDQTTTRTTKWLDDRQKLISLKSSPPSKVQYLNEKKPESALLYLRDKNPVPYAAWLNFSEENLSICSSSPEIFLRLDRDGISNQNLSRVL